jgi:hypothetical protein
MELFRLDARYCMATMDRMQLNPMEQLLLIAHNINVFIEEKTLKYRFFTLVLFTLALILSACSPQAVPSPTAQQATQPVQSTATAPSAGATTPIITIERTACHGTCPVYSLSIFQDGKVEYDGLDFVQVKGKQTGSITPDQVQELTNAFKEADYFNLKDEYKAPVTDLATTTTSFTLDGKTKTVSNYGGCLEGSPDKAPQALCDLEKHIDLIAHAAQWIGK